jgi:hypothetical protein
MEESILTSIKLLLGAPEEYTAFDPQIIMHINSVFTILHQLGVGTEEPFKITGKEETWSDFIEEGELECVKEYIYCKVKLIFDPPANSFVVEQFNKRIDECEWRMNVKEDKT